MANWDRILKAVDAFQAIAIDDTIAADEAALVAVLGDLSDAFQADCVSLETHATDESEVLQFDTFNVDPGGRARICRLLLPYLTKG